MFSKVPHTNIFGWQWVSSIFSNGTGVAKIARCFLKTKCWMGEHSLSFEAIHWCYTTASLWHLVAAPTRGRAHAVSIYCPLLHAAPPSFMEKSRGWRCRANVCWLVMPADSVCAWDGEEAFGYCYWVCFWKDFLGKKRTCWARLCQETKQYKLSAQHYTNPD